MEEVQKARDCALRILARRDHSAAELKRKLLQRSFLPAAVEAVISSFIASGYLNDRCFAERWAVAAMASGRCFGPRLKAELGKRGIDRVTVAEVFTEQSCEIDENEALQKLVNRRFPEFDPSSADDRYKRRIFGFLQRRGFSAEAIVGMFRGERVED